MHLRSIQSVMSDEFESLIERRRESGPRVHTDLTDRFRERLLQIITPIDSNSRGEAFNRLFQRLGYSEIQNQIHPSADHSMDVVNFVGRNLETAEARIILDADMDLTVSYVEYLIKYEWESISGRGPLARSRRDAVRDIMNEIIRALESEAILWELKSDGSGGVRFEQMGTEAMQEADEEVRGLIIRVRLRSHLRVEGLSHSFVQGEA
jgi:hypothetical protein